MLLQTKVARSAINSAATTNAQLLSATAARLLTFLCSNVNAAARFVKLYDKATAPVVGTDVPVLTVPVPANGVVSLNLGMGHHFTNGIGIAITGAAADTDTTAVAAGDVKVTATYA